jgi:hypothetical protein
MHLTAVIHLIVLLAGAQSDGAAAAAFYSVGYYDCLAIEEQHQVRVGSPRILLAAAQKPLPVTIDVMVPWQEPSTARRPHGDCTGAYKSSLDNPKGARPKVTQYAHVAPLPADHFDYEVCFAVPASGAVIISGAPIAMGAPARRRLVEGIRSSLPRDWRPDRTLARAYRYRSGSGHTIDELYVGLPTRNRAGASPPIKRISIRRFFLIDGRLAGSQAYERESGVEERVDTEAPELTDENWSRSETEQTVAFVSRDNGASWERLSTNTGFEGVHWIVQSLREGLPELYRRWLYTHH